MKIKTCFFTIELDILLIIILLMSFFSEIVLSYLAPFYLCYLFILFHEFSHILLAAVFGFDVKNLKLSLSGVCAEFVKKIEDKFDLRRILIFLAGPMSNYLLAFLFKSNMLIYSTNLFLGTLNLLPIYPLDGYKILKIILQSEKYNKIYLIDIVGNVFYFVLFLIGIYQTVMLFNPSILIFLFYLYMIKLTKNKRDRVISNIEKMEKYVSLNMKN